MFQKNSLRKRITEFRKVMNAIKLGCHSFYRSLKQQGCRIQKENFSNFKKPALNLCITERQFGGCLGFYCKKSMLSET